MARVTGGRVPPEVVLDEAGVQVLAFDEDGKPFPRYLPCSEGCGYYIGCGDAVDSISHHSCRQAAVAVDGPIVRGVRAAWFHSHRLPDALRAAADWLDTHENEGAPLDVHTRLGWLDAEGCTTHGEDPDGTERWSVAVFQDQ